MRLPPAARPAKNIRRNGAGCLRFATEKLRSGMPMKIPRRCSTAGLGNERALAFLDGMQFASCAAGETYQKVVGRLPAFRPKPVNPKQCGEKENSRCA